MEYKLSFAARVLLRFCREPGTTDYPMKGIHHEGGKELDRLLSVFPDIRKELAGKDVIDFGCGMGYQCAAFALAGAHHVIGVEINQDALQLARRHIAEQGLAGKVSLVSKIPLGTKADVIVSQNSFEHFIDAAEVLEQMRAALAPGGKIFITFAPPWYAPWGAHVRYFCRLPWVQVLFSERTVMDVRSLFRSDGARTYREGGVACMTLSKFERLVRSFRCDYRRYDCIRGLDWLHRTALREFFVNRVSCVLLHDPKAGG